MVIVEVVLTVVGGGKVTVGEVSDEPLEVVFQFHGLDVPLKLNDEVSVGKEVSSSVLELGLLTTSGEEMIGLPLVGDDVGNTSVGLPIVVIVPRLNNVHQG